MKVKVRYAPSPTGNFHVGTMRTCLYNYLFAKKHKGEVLMRSEDTDKERSKKEYEDNIISGLKSMGLIEDSTEIFRQSERTEIYKKYLQKLLDSGDAYYCFMTVEELEAEKKEQEKNKLPPRYSGKFRDYTASEALKRVKSGEKAVIRLKVPQNRNISFNDLVRGETGVNTKELDDFVIAKSLDYPLYNLTVVVDDIEMGITHVLRGEDHISNTPKQILIYEAFGAKTPEFGHFSLILNEDRSKMSKRKNKVTVDDYLNEGYLKEALINFLVLLGWNTSDEKEIFSLDELIQVFSLEGLNKSGAIFDIKKLDWMNSVYIKNLSFDALKNKIKDFLNDDLKRIYNDNPKVFNKMLSISHERLKKLSEINNEFPWYFNPKKSELHMYPNAKMKVTEESAIIAIKEVLPLLESLDEKNWNKEDLTNVLVKFVEDKGQKNAYYLWPLRVALTREQFSPGTMEVMDLLGKEESVRRIKGII